MNPLVYIILVWERELEIQRQQVSGYDPFVILQGEEHLGEKIANPSSPASPGSIAPPVSG